MVKFCEYIRYLLTNMVAYVANIRKYYRMKIGIRLIMSLKCMHLLVTEVYIAICT